MIGTYYRLSLADEDVGADKAESNSIQGQRGLVEGYIMARPELATEPRQEYVDDGYSGTASCKAAIFCRFSAVFARIFSLSTPSALLLVASLSSRHLPLPSKR